MLGYYWCDLFNSNNSALLIKSNIFKRNEQLQNLIIFGSKNKNSKALLYFNPNHNNPNTMHASDSNQVAGGK